MQGNGNVARSPIFYSQVTCFVYIYRNENIFLLSDITYAVMSILCVTIYDITQNSAFNYKPAGRVLIEYREHEEAASEPLQRPYTVLGIGIKH